MNRRILLADVAVAVVVAVLILVLTPGLAISGVIGLLILLVLGVVWLIERWRRRATRYRRANIHHPPGSSGSGRTHPRR